MEHAYFSPSAASRWIACPASLYLSEQIATGGNSKYAHEGTICHNIAADCLTKRILPTDFLGKIIEKVVLSQELVESIQLYVDEIRGLAKEYKALGGKIEHKVELTKECWGTADAMMWNDDTLLICDLKMGKGVVVDAENNAQLKLYAIGGLKWLEMEHQIRPTKIVNIIIQPRTPDPVRRYRVDRKNLATWYRDKVAPILATHTQGVQSDIPCNPGAIQCRWCGVSATCGAQANKVLNDAQHAFAPFTEATAPIIPAINKELSLEEIAQCKKTFKHIQQWMKEIDAFINEKALAGEPIPGFKLVEGRSIRIWRADETQVVAFMQNINMEPYTKKLMSPAQAEKSLGKKQAKEYDLYALIKKPKGQPTLVAQSDKRPEIQIQTEEELEATFEEFTTPLITNDSQKDSKEVTQLSALQRMRLMGEEEEEEEEEEEKTEEKKLSLVESATGGNPKVLTQVLGATTPIPPSTRTKRSKVLQMGEEGATTLQMAADILRCKDNTIRMHLQYLNERDGYSYQIFDDFTFKVFKGEK